MGLISSKLKQKKRRSAPHSVCSQVCGTDGSSDPSRVTLSTKKPETRVNSPPSKAMENAEESAVDSEDGYFSRPSAKEGSTESACVGGRAIGDDFSRAAASAQSATSQGAASVTSRIELSKCHWSERVEIDCNSTDDEIAADNLEVFQALQKHPRWGDFFHTFGYDTEVFMSSGEMVVGEKLAEGGQAELFHAHITWQGTKYNEYCEREGLEWVLKVFKRGTSLWQLQSHWPHGYLDSRANDVERERLGYPKGIRWHCKVMHGTLMRDGTFAFVMLREMGDLRSQIDERMLKCGVDVGPFSKEEVEVIMYRIARGVDWLHEQNIVHRDIKASTVLVGVKGHRFIADYECSVGVVGTGLWRAPEVLQACKERSVNQRPELFTKASDVYSYGMTCYEVLTGKHPFGGEGVSISNVIKGKHPHIPEFVDAKHKELLLWCWQLDPSARPSFDAILRLLEGHPKSLYIKRKMLVEMKDYDGGHALLGWTNPSHGLELLESGRNEGTSYMCKLCLEMGNGEVYHCTSCGDFDIHPECARVRRELVSFLHPHELDLWAPDLYPDNHRCDGCLENLDGSQWVYRCGRRGCDFDLHARCGKYAKTMSHDSHKEHKLLLIFNSAASIVDASMMLCDGCKIGIRLEELVYHCEECNFYIHSNCSLDNRVC